MPEERICRHNVTNQGQESAFIVTSEHEGFFVFSFSFFPSIVAVSPMWPERDLNRMINNNPLPVNRELIHS